MFETDSERHPSSVEINLETPIFHALTAGRFRQDPLASEPDELIEFHRDPLLAPIPVRAYVEPVLAVAAPVATPVARATIAPLPAAAGSSHGSALSMMTSWIEQAVLDPASEYGRHHRPVPALPCAYRW